MKDIKNIIVEGTFFALSGYSSATRNFWHEFIKKYDKKYTIYLYDRQWDKVRINLDEKIYGDTILSHIYNREEFEPTETLYLRWGVPTAFPSDEEMMHYPFAKRIIYFVWELDRLPQLWLDRLVNYDAILTCSKFSADAIKRSIGERGMTTPVEIIPHGVSDSYFKMENPPKDDKSFVFLCVGTPIDRKAWKQMIVAFLDEFDGDENVKLIWKIGDIDDRGFAIHLKKEIQKIAFGKDRSKSPQIILDVNSYNSQTMNMLYNGSDALILVSHGEAWGLPLLNAMKTGTPTIALDQGGQRQFCTSKTTWFVKNKGQVPSTGQGWYDRMQGLKWFDIDMDSYKRALRTARTSFTKKGNPNKARKLKIQAGLEQAEKYLWSKVAGHGMVILKRLFNE